jgi:ankyrin repeat protein
MTSKLKFRWWGKTRLEQAFTGELDFGLLDSRGYGPLHWCVLKSERELFLKVLTFDVQINQRSAHTKSTPLHFAAIVEDSCYMEALIVAGADINAVDWHRQTPLHIAAENGHISHARLLVDAGAALKGFDHDKRSPLDLAFKEARMEVIEFLCAFPEARHRSWSRRLLRVAQYHQPEVVKWLLERGANPLTKNKFGQTAIEIAKIPPYNIDFDETTAEESAKLDRNMRSVVSMLESLL